MGTFSRSLVYLSAAFAAAQVPRELQNLLREVWQLTKLGSVRPETDPQQAHLASDYTNAGAAECALAQAGDVLERELSDVVRARGRDLHRQRDVPPLAFG